MAEIDRWALERACWARGIALVCGCDEAGAGPLAGAVYAGAVILPPECSMLLVGSKHQLDARGEVNIFKMPTPIRREEMLITVRLMLQFGRRVEKLMRPARSAMEQQLVDRAKQALMARFDISEEEAHRRLQKRSMDSGRKLSQTARRVLAELEE